MRKIYNVRYGVQRIRTKADNIGAWVAITVTSLATAIALPLATHAASQVVVTPTNQQGWSTADTRPGGAVNFVTDPSAPGNPNLGALQLTTDATNAAKAQYIHAANTPLTQVNELSYYTKQNSASSPTGDPSYQVQVCLGGVVNGACAGYTNLVYEPYWNGTVVPGTWQQWNVMNGQLWSSATYTDANNPLCSVVSGAGGPPFYSITQLQTACPNAVVTGFGVNVGTYNPSYDVEADLVDFNGTIYNFEPATETVTIDKYVDGQQATPASANNSAFPMVSSWSASNIGTGSGSYTLSPTGFNSSNPYEAVTSDMSQGASYSTNEVTTGPTVSTTCSVGGAPYALVGYTTGDTLAAAQSGTPSLTAPSFTNLQGNKYVIVWNKSCTTPTTKDQCKNGGWENFNTPTFKNQGDCVSFVATGGKNPASTH